MKKHSRRNFLATGATGITALSLAPLLQACGEDPATSATPVTPLTYKGGLVLSTWDFGLKSNEEAWRVLQSGGNAVDMAEKGVNLCEADLTELSVGLGALPDREGHTTLDACIMAPNGKAGSVMFLENIKHPASVARRVMEKTPHVQLVGDGAYRFAISEGFPHDDYKNPEAVKAYEAWLKESKYEPIINIENHDTIGLLAMDTRGDIAGACTTSGLAYKMRGRVGDSPIIGAGLYVDNEVGGATSTGLGEAVIRTCGSFLVVECMRRGATPREACEEAVRRIQKKHDNWREFQVGFLAVNKAGEIGAFSLQEGFTYALHKDGKGVLEKSEWLKA
ncbi:MAG: N(4)-(beta-N-acetylglucosaminyl)-L-asparaginase [Flavobacteriales bacterium]|nr:N(4)-(beta-N-acetylglucosaminyl)-L-asparaginase [Flavobacteriales bacterium]